MAGRDFSVVGIERLERILRVVAASPFVKNAHQISVNLIGPTGGGKSALMLRNLPATARVLDDITTASLLEVMDDRVKGNIPPEWIVIPDFNKVVAHKASVTNLTMGTLLAFLAEGVTEIPGLDGESKIKASALQARGSKFGLITGMTPDVFFSRRGTWRKIGLLRRVLPVFYGYTGETIGKIQSSIQLGADALSYAHERLAQKTILPIEIPKAISVEVRCLSESVTSTQLVWRSGARDSVVTQAVDLPFTLHKDFRAYIRAHARLSGRKVVTKIDLEALRDLCRFVRYDQAEMV